ncbi:hypothetical protein BE963_14115 [Escherichia coli]|nr:hypothetical protein BE963_14115 [Escherichia coli]
MRRKRLIRPGWKGTVGRIRCASIASGDSCRMRHKRLIQPCWRATVGRIRCASIASGDQVARYQRDKINDAYSLTTSSATSARG